MLAEAFRRRKYVVPMNGDTEKWNHSKLSFYRKIARACYEIKSQAKDSTMKKSFDNGYDMGCGQGCRFVCSSNKILNEEELSEMRDTLRQHLKIHDQEMKRCKNDNDRLSVVIKLQHSMMKDLNGYGPLRSQLLIQCCAMFGLISIDFYEFLPCHFTGGVGKFLVEEVGYDKSPSDTNEFVQWNVGFVQQLQDIYGRNCTYNQFENLACVISRYYLRHDHFFFMPWITNTNEWSKEDRLQLFFRYNAYTKSMEGFDGKVRFVLLSENSPSRGLINWGRNRNGSIDNTIPLKIDVVNNEIYKNIYN